MKRYAECVVDFSNFHVDLAILGYLSRRLDSLLRPTHPVGLLVHGQCKRQLMREPVTYKQVTSDVLVS